MKIADRGITVHEAAKALIASHTAKIADLYEEISAARVRLRRQYYANMLEAERLATNAERFLPPIKSRLKVFYGNCVNGLDDENFRDRIANDATELAQLVENSTPMTRAQAEFEISELKEYGENIEFGINNDRNVAWAYDPSKDIHYFHA